MGEVVCIFVGLPPKTNSERFYGLAHEFPAPPVVEEPYFVMDNAPC
jgi:hypothetical protein